MTDLTEKWEKGELEKRRRYYVRDGEKIFTSYLDEHNCFLQSREEDTYQEYEEYTTNCDEVLSKVPRYKEWQAKLEENNKLKEELKDYENQHKQDGICYDDIFCKLELARKENRQFKTDSKSLARKLLQVKPELREWLETNYKEYL